LVTDLKYNKHWSIFKKKEKRSGSGVFVINEDGRLKTEDRSEKRRAQSTEHSAKGKEEMLCRAKSQLRLSQKEKDKRKERKA
jgi:hypothetical protein